MKNELIAARATIGAVLLACLPACRSAPPSRPGPRPLDGVRNYLAYRPSYGPTGRAPVTIGNYAGFNYRNRRTRVEVVPAPPIATPVAAFAD